MNATTYRLSLCLNDARAVKWWRGGEQSVWRAGKTAASQLRSARAKDKHTLPLLEIIIIVTAWAHYRRVRRAKWLAVW